MIEVKNLSKKFGDQWALRDTSWSITDGRSLGLLGPNGAGKSTTLKIMTGLLCSTEGSVLIEGENILTSPVEAKRKIGYLPETPPLYEEIKVIDFLNFVAGLKSVQKSQRASQVDAAIEKLQLQEVAYRPIRVLSKGFRQRVGIAQTLIGDPKILILDEPSVGLDPHQVFELRNIIKDLKKNHIVILSTHILSEVQQVCDDVVILDKGVVKTKGSLKDILNQQQGVRKVEIRLNKINKDLSEVLKAMPLVSSVETSGSTLKLFLQEQAMENLDPYLEKIVASQGGIQSVQPIHQQLEDVFIEVTK